VTLLEVQSRFADAGCEKLYAKPLAENDNSKNQVYFGQDFKALNLFPNEGIVADSSPQNEIFKAKLNFAWLLENGKFAEAPGAQIILYPQYPEVRFSGFLKGCASPPSELMRMRKANRILFLGVTSQQQHILGFVVDSNSSAAKEFRNKFAIPTIGVFSEIPLPKILDEAGARFALLKELRRINGLGWINSKQLSADGTLLPCEAPQCGGFTLEAELGIPKNSKSEPDFHGWEVKQYAVPNFDLVEAGRLTLMTPEPTGGLYKDDGPEAFIRRFGYADTQGRIDRMNFGGLHRAGERNARTELTIILAGYDPAKGRIMNANGAIQLVNDEGAVAASWGFGGLMQHWTRKHARAVYVPSQVRKEPQRQYRYGKQIRLAVGTDFLRFLKAFAAGRIFYDPGIKLESASSKPKVKRRSQFRVKSKDISSLYESVEVVQL